MPVSHWATEALRLPVTGSSTIAPAFEKNLTARLQEWVAERMTSELEEVKEVCRQHWEKACPRAEERLDMKLGDFDEAAAKLDAHAARAVEKSKRVVRKITFGNHVAQQC